MVADRGEWSELWLLLSEPSRRLWLRSVPLLSRCSGRMLFRSSGDTPPTSHIQAAPVLPGMSPSVCGPPGLRVRPPGCSVCASREASQFFREPRVKQLKVSWNYFNSVWGRSTSSTSPSALPDLTSRLIVKVTDGTSANGNGTVLGVLRCAGACVGTVRCSQERGVVALVAGVAPSCCCCD